MLPLVHKAEIKQEKAAEAVGFLIEIVEGSSGSLGTSSVRAVVKCVGVLVAEFCDSNDWNSVKLGLDWLLKFSLDKRPKVFLIILTKVYAILYFYILVNVDTHFNKGFE